MNAAPEPIELVDYDPGWPEAFSTEAHRLTQAIPRLRFHHIGSTAVPGLPAKPVIDLLALAGEPLDAYVAPMEAVGYRNTVRDEARWFFRDEPRRHHVHLVSTEAELQRHLRFRDALLESATLRDEYAELKRRLAREHAGDREAYAAAKDPFVRRVLVRRATIEDAAEVGRLLHAFNTEYGEPSPPPEVVGPRVLLLPDTRVLITGDPPHGLAVLRLRPSIWTPGLEAYLAELYVAPGHRGHGDGRALLEATVALAREEGADWIELNTSEDDVAARALYEKFGFTNREGRPDGPVMLYYEREL